MPGVDLVLPDFTYLRENAERVDGIILTHGHEDHTGGLAYLLRDFSVPIYGSELTLGLARNRVDEAGLADRAQFIPVARRRAPADRSLRRRVHPGHPLGAPRLRHRIPHPAGRDPPLRRLQDRPPPGRRAPHRPGPDGRPGADDPGIRLLLSDSTNAEEPGFTASESTVGATLAKVFLARPDRRLIVTCFASHIHRIQQVADAAIAGGRMVATLGRSMAEERGARPPSRPAAHPRRLDRRRSRTSTTSSPGKVCVISTGSQGEPMSALSRLADRREPLASGCARTTSS